MIVLFGLLAVMAPYLLSLVGREFFLGPWFWWIAGGVTILAGCWSVYSGMRRFQIRIDESGIFADTAELKVSLPWDVVEAVTIQQLPHAQPQHSRYVVAWPFPGREPAKPNFYDRTAGRKAFNIVDLSSVLETEDEVAEALRRYAGGRFVSAAR